LELDALKKATEEFKALGATFIAISPQLQSFNREFREEKKLTFEILSDPGNEVAQRYGLTFKLPEDLKEIYVKFNIDLEKYNGDDSWTLPLPARLIIDQESIIRYAAINADYTVRPDPEETIAALKNIMGQ
jgi:peroxiredoxin